MNIVESLLNNKVSDRIIIEKVCRRFVRDMLSRTHIHWEARHVLKQPFDERLANYLGVIATSEAILDPTYPLYESKCSGLGSKIEKCAQNLKEFYLSTVMDGGKFNPDTSEEWQKILQDIVIVSDHFSEVVKELTKHDDEFIKKHMKLIPITTRRERELLAGIFEPRPISINMYDIYIKSL